MLSSKLRALCFNTETTALNMILNQSSGCKAEVQKERGELPPAISNNGHIRLFVLAAINVVAIYQERANIPPRQKNVCFHYMTDVESFICPFLQEWACKYSFNTNLRNQAKNEGCPASRQKLTSTVYRPSI